MPKSKTRGHAAAPVEPPDVDADRSASPPCYLNDADSTFLGFLSASEVASLLNLLLEGERAGAKGAWMLSKQAASPGVGATLRHIAADEARFTAMLNRHIVRLRATPSRETGAFYEKLLDQETFAGQLTLFDRGQGWVVRKLREVLPRIRDDLLYRDLREMLEAHERNIGRCDTGTTVGEDV